MGNIGAHVWTIICSIVIFALALTAWFIGFGNLHDGLASDNLQSATRTALYMASDKSSRAERGAFVVNKGEFAKVMDNTKVKAMGNKKLGDTGYQIYYLKGDTNPAISKHDTADNTDSYKPSNNKGYEAIRAVSIVADYGHPNQVVGHYKFASGQTQKGTSKADQAKLDKYTATDVVQTNDKQGGSNNNHFNDLTE